jgi:hypothetical protein
VCHWGVESCKLMFPSTVGHVPACVDMSYRPAESFPSRGSSTCPRHTVGGKTSKKDPEQGVASSLCGDW